MSAAAPRPLDGVRGVLLDVDGTLLVGDRAIPGAGAALERLRERGLAYRVFTNTTRRSRRHVAATLWGAGVLVREDEVLAPSVLARRVILGSGHIRACLLVAPSSLADFAGVVSDDDAPDWVVVGDLGAGFTFERLNLAYRLLSRGARLLALHKNRAWHAGDDGMQIDAGAFVVALEYASGVTAEVVGKPAPAFFQLALDELGLPAASVLVVGDDVEADVLGGSRAGCRTALVETGKFEPSALERARPDFVLRSISDL